jgi:hypothetical protein
VLLAGLLLLFTAIGAPLAAQDNLDANVPADSQLAGTVHAPDGTPIPGTTLHVIHTSTGKAWVTWTDESGKFEFPALPAGHYRVDTTQIGFVPATKEIDLVSGTLPPIDLKMDVGTLAAITAPPAEQNATAPGAQPTKESAQAASSGAPSSKESESATVNPSATEANKGAATPEGRIGRRNGGQGAGGNGQQGGANGASQRGGRQAFQRVGLNGQDQNPAETGGDDQTTAEAGGQLGQAASADAVQMIGTVAMGQVPPGGFPQAGEGGPSGLGGFGNGDNNAIPGQTAPGGFGGSDGGPGIFVMRGGGRRGPQGGPQGVDALWGAQRVMRQRINRIHYSFYDTFGDSAFNARPYSLYEANPPKISSWTESAGLNIGGPV